MGYDIKKIQKILKEKGVDIAVFLGFDPSIKYFSGFSGFSYLILPVFKDPYLLVPELEFSRAKEVSSIKVEVFPKNLEGFWDHLLKNFSVGINFKEISAFKYNHFKKIPGVKLLDVSKEVFSARIIKSKKEIEKISFACGFTDELFKKVFRGFERGEFVTETDVSSFLLYETFRAGLTPAFDPIVASGNHSSLPHHAPKNVSLKKGFCVIDFGVKFKGYCSDMTRTIFLGVPSKKELRLYEKILSLQKTLIGMVGCGINCSFLHNFTKKELGKGFIHGLGHGIGIEVHESPRINEKSADIFAKNMVFTIEPGIYKVQGIRIEDTLVLSNNGPISLTKTTKKLLVFTI